MTKKPQLYLQLSLQLLWSKSLCPLQNSCGNPNVRYGGISKWDLWEVLTCLRNGTSAL